MTGTVMGSNKIRNLQYLLVDVLPQDCDLIFSSRREQSNLGSFVQLLVCILSLKCEPFLCRRGIALNVNEETVELEWFRVL